MGSQQPPIRAERKKKLKNRPWLHAGGEEIPTGELEKISKAWNSETWEEYLGWYESSRREALVTPLIYKKKGEEISESIFVSRYLSVTPAKRNLCERILALLPELHSSILRLHYLEGLALTKVAPILGRSKSNLAHHKRSAISNLKRGLGGDIWSVCRFMREEKSQESEVTLSVWDESSPLSIRENRDYLSCDQRSVIDGLKNDHLRGIFLELGKYAQRILYLRHWCDLTKSAIARDLALGCNVVEQIEDAAIKKIKQKAIEFQTGIQMGGA